MSDFSSYVLLFLDTMNEHLFSFYSHYFTLISLNL